MKKNILSALLFHIGLLLSAQTPVFDWAAPFGGDPPFATFDLDVALDDVGHVYTTGTFSGTVDFDPGINTYNLTSAGDTEVFISKLDALGNFIWAKHFEGTEQQQGRAIAIDDLGNIYSTGIFSGVVDFDPGLDNYNLTADGESDMYVSKLDASGNFIWAKQMGGAGRPLVLGLSLDGLDNVYCTGSFEGTVDFDPGPGAYNLINQGNLEDDDAFINKLDASGNFVWAKQIGGINGTAGAGAIDVDLFGNIYTTGGFDDTVDFDPGPEVYYLSSAGGNCVFVSKLSGDGNFIWARAMESEGLLSYGSGLGIAIDIMGNVHLTGRFSGTVDFDPGSDNYSLISNAGKDIFISKLDSLGNFIWANSIGGGNIDIGYAIDLDALGNVYTTGVFNETVDFDPGPGIFELTESGLYDAFISKLDRDGTFVWAGALSGSSGQSGFALTLDPAGNIYTTGRFGGSVDFDPGPGQYNLSASSYDIFVHKMKQCLLAPYLEGELLVCLGDTVTLTAGLLDTLPIPVEAAATYQWESGLSTATNFVVPSENTTYTVTITDANACDYVQSITINLRDLPELTISADPEEICVTDSSYLQANGGTSYLWNTGDSTNHLTITPDSSSTYIVTITDANSCTNQDSISIVVHPLPEISISEDLELCPYDSTILFATGGISYSWDTGDSYSEIVISPNSNTIYTVTVTDGNNCSDLASVQVSVDEENCPPCAKLPSAFTPDADGHNDVFRVLQAEELEVLDFRIYNRWGGLVHNSVLSWDGKWNGVPQPMEVYVFVVRVKSYCGVEELRGEVTLIR